MSDEDQFQEDNRPEAVAQLRRPWGLMRMLRLCRKELRETVRDRRTIFTLILMPLLAYPLLSMAFQRLIFSSAADGRLECVVGVENEEAAARLDRWLAAGQTLVNQENRDRRNSSPPNQERPNGPTNRNPANRNPANREPASGEPANRDPANREPAGGEPAGERGSEMTRRRDPTLRFLITEALETAVADGEIDVGVRVAVVGSRPLVPGLGRPLKLDLVLRENSTLSQQGAKYMEERLRRVNEFYVRRVLVSVGASSRLPIEIRSESVSESGSAMSLTAFIPLILLLMTITGAVYPAIDLTAGERERGTLETLMAAPVPRFGLLVAKYIAVVTIAMLTATTNLIAMTITLMATGMGPIVFGPEGPTVALFDQVFFLLMLFAAFFSAILLAITSFARSFKEAQSYLIPLMLVTLAPGIMSLMPNLEFTGPLAVLPLVNIVLLARDLLEGGVDSRLATVAVLSTMFYAVAALGLAARIFGTDAILYGSQATWSDLARRPDQPRDLPTISGVFICLAFIYPCYFLLANVLYRFSDASMTFRLLMTAGVTALLFVGLPLVAAVLQRARFKSTFQLHRVAPLSLAGATLLGASLWPFAHEVFMLNEYLGLKSLDLDQIESVRSLLDSWQSVSPWIILFSLALAPAVCEEFFFRGYLLGALRQSMPDYSALAISAVLFGVFHVITTSLLATERLLPSTFMGFVLGWICLKTGSVLPGMISHAFHNGVLLMIAYYRDDLIRRGWGIEEQDHMPISWLTTAAAVVAIGVILILVTRKRIPIVRSGPPGTGRTRC